MIGDPTGQSIEEWMLLASGGSADAAKQFYVSLMQVSLVIPERYQGRRLRETVQYPNEFLNLFAVQLKDRVTIPAFTKPEWLKEWAEDELLSRTLPTRELLALVPESWTVTINPGQEVEKELSWWEITRLKQGSESIPEIVSEVMEDSLVKAIEIRPAASGSHEETKKALIEAARSLASVKTLYVALEVGRDLDDHEVTTVLVGAEINGGQEAVKNASDVLSAAGQRTQIGGDAVRVLVGTSRESVTLGVFRDFEPLYETPHQGIWERFKTRFSSLLRSKWIGTRA